MEPKTVASAGPRTDVEYEAEAKRLAAEIRAMLDDARRTTDQTRRIRQGTRAAIDALEQQLLCGKT